MELDRVRDAYSALSGQYVELVSSWPDDTGDTELVRRHLTGLAGPVLDLGCGPGHWTGRLHALGVDVSGVDAVPEFIAHARASYPGPQFHLASMTEVDLAPGTCAGLLSWYSTIHLSPAQLAPVLAGFRRLLDVGGVLVLGFFDSADVVAEFDHRVMTAYRWPVDELAALLAKARFTEVERRQHQVAERPDRRYAALVVRAT